MSNKGTNEPTEAIETKPRRIRRAWWLVRSWFASLPRRRILKALRRHARKRDSGTIAHARREFLAIGYDPNDREDGPNKWIQNNLMELLAVFTMQGHSGSSAPYCANVFKKLALFEPLAPLTGEDSEWQQVRGDMWQNLRCGHVFKDAEGNAYDGEGRIFREPNGACYTSSESSVPVTFPYTPKRVYVDVPVEAEDGEVVG